MRQKLRKNGIYKSDKDSLILLQASKYKTENDETSKAAVDKISTKKLTKDEVSKHIIYISMIIRLQIK